MSRLAKRPILIPGSVTASIEGETLILSGPKGSLTLNIDSSIEVEKNQETLVIKTRENFSDSKATPGLFWALVSNMIKGVTEGFQKNLELQGVGLRVQKQGENLMFSLGFSHPVEVKAVPGASFIVESQNKFSVTGIDSQIVGQVAANIRGLKVPDRYKGKGIRYEGEVVTLKAGKKAS